MKQGRIVSKITHMSISVDGVLNQYKRRPIKFCSNDDGTQMNPQKARQIFEMARYEGKKVLPMSDKCYRFCFQKGCKGHIKSIKPTEDKLKEIESKI